MSRARKSISKTITMLIVVALIVGAIGIAYFVTSGFTSKDPKLFYVKINDESILSRSGGYVISPAEPLIVKLVYPLDFALDTSKEYKATIEYNKEVEYSFAVDNVITSLSTEDNVSDMFTIDKGESILTVTPKGGISEIIQFLYPNKSIGGIGTAPTDLFVLTITSNQATIKIYFTVEDSAEGVTISPGVIVI